MHFLGISTTRAGTCITSDSKVVRDMFYDGHPKDEKCTIVSRIAPTFIRFGSFEIFKTLDPTTGRVGPSVGRVEILHSLLNYVIETFYPEIFKDSDDPVQRYAEFFKEIILRTARLVAQWQCIGFCHGVLNTDNMSIVGLTLDYGPFGFLDMFDPNHICNATDEGGRYSFTKQPEICLWNLKKLSEVIQQALPLNISSPLLDLFQPEFQTTYLKKMRAKLGLIATEPHADDDDMCLIQELFDTMEKTGADFTNTFLCLLHVSSDALDRSLRETSEKLVGNCYPLQLLIAAQKPSVDDSQIQVFKAIAASNPEIVEKLGRAGLPINRVLIQLQKAESLMGLTQESKTEQDVRLWNTWLEKYKSRLLEDIKCYKGDAYDEERNSVMKSNNPRFILRNYLLQGAIEKAEMGDYSEVQKLMEVLQNPCDHSYSEVVSLRDTQTANQGTHTGPSGSCSSYANNLDYPPREAFSLRVS